jgi:hypothetical protein
MSKVKNLKNDVKSKIEAVKKINDNPKSGVDKVYDKYLNDLKSSEELYGKKFDDFLAKRKKKNENKKNIFEELVDIADSIISDNRAIISSNRMQTKNKIKQHALDAADKVLAESKNVVLENVKKIFFAGDGICGANKTISEVSIEISPKEFDFLNYLTIDPSTAVGKIIYEPTNDIGKVKLNTELYTLFSGGTYTFTSLTNNDLFDIKWDSSAQKYLITGFTQTNPLPNVEEFLNDYYSTIELPDIEHIIKTAMLYTIQGDGSDTPLFNQSFNVASRALNKIFSFCSTSTDRDELVNQTAVDMFDENDQDPEFYFDFDDVEGIDLDDEDTRYRKVLKFTDCNNFEVNTNPRMISDFVYLTTKKTIKDAVNSTLNRSASDAFSQSNGDIPEINFNLSLLSSFIFNIPRAIALSVFSPKILLGIVVIYKIFKSGLLNTIEDVKIIIKNLSKLFFNVISELFWIFIREFWKLLKSDLLSFMSALAATIIANKAKRYVFIVTTLISLLTRIIESGVDNCEDLFSAISKAIDAALNADTPITIPNLLLGISDALPGYSQDRAYINVIERMEAAGIDTGPIFGEENKLPSIIKSMIDGNTEEIDKNSFVKVVLKPGILPGPSGGAIITPATFSAVGKFI